MIQCVLFDLDGTTVDTNELIIWTIQHLFRWHGGTELSRDSIIAQMGGPLEDQMRHFSGRDDVADLVRLYRKYNGERHDEMVALFPGVLDTVRRLHEAGRKIGIVTNKSRDSTVRTLDMFGLSPYVRSVVTSEDVARPKPDPEPIVKAMRELGARPEETVMVGDSPYDLLAAKAAGVTAVAVGWSLKARDVLVASGADRIIGDMRELLDVCGVAAGGRT